MLPALFSRTSLILEDIEVSPRKILELIGSLDSNKAHECDDVSSSILRICDEAIVLSLKLIYTSCLEKGVYPNLWEKANVSPIHKEENRQLTKSYRPISLLPICGKLYEKIFDEIYMHIKGNNLLFISMILLGLVSDVRLFADDTSLSSIVCYEQVSADILNTDLKFVEKWAYQ